MSNDRHIHEIHEFDDDFSGEDFAEAQFAEPEFPEPPFGPPRPRGPKGPNGRRRHHGHGPEQDNPIEALFGPGGPFGKSGPFGKGGFFGPQAADVARTIWENATADQGRGRGPQYERRAERRDERRDERGGRREHGDWDGRGERRRGPGGPGGPGEGARGRWEGPRGRGRGFGDEGPRGRGRGRRPKGDIRLAALLLIDEEARNGYQIIEELAARTSGTWRPSSGAVYPALAQLEDEGLIEAFDNEGRKAYRLTDAGREAVAANEAPAPWETATADASEALGGRSGGEMWQAFGQVAMATKAVAATRDEAALTEAAKVLEQTRRSLYRILADGPQDAVTTDES